jgi:hypothetical protein
MLAKLKLLNITYNKTNFIRIWNLKLNRKSCKNIGSFFEYWSNIKNEDKSECRRKSESYKSMIESWRSKSVDDSKPGGNAKIGGRYRARAGEGYD